MLKKAKAFLRKERFRPGPAGVFVNPFHLARKALYREICSFAPRVSGRVLDVGCGQKPYSDLFDYDIYVGLEIYSPEDRRTKAADIWYDGGRFPFADGVFDWIIASQVFEHVFEPDGFIMELYRVLKPGGGLLMSVPFSWDEHEKPHDYARYSSFGLNFILEKHRFRVLERKKTLADIRIVFQMINTYIYKITVTRNPYVNLLSCMILMAPFSIMGEALSRILPGNPDLYLDNIIVAKK